MHDGYYVQVRYPGGRRWVTVAVSETRAKAAKLAAEFYRYLPDARGQAPMAVRITSTSELVRRGGEAAINRAAADLEHSAKS